MRDPNALKKWIDAATSSVAEVSVASLGCETSFHVDGSADLHGTCGSLLTVGSGKSSTTLVFSSSPEGCRSLAGAMLGLDDEGAAELSHDDVRDSVGELVNVIAGAVKTKMIEGGADLVLGLPMFLEGSLEPDHRTTCAQIRCDVGAIPCVLTLLVGPGEDEQDSRRFVCPRCR